MRYTTVSLDKLPIGSRLGASIIDSRQTKLLNAGMEISEQLIASLRRRSVYTVSVSNHDLGRIQAFKPQGKNKAALDDRGPFFEKHATEHTRMLDDVSASQAGGPLTASAHPFSDRLHRPGAVSYDADLTQQLVESHEQEIEKLDGLMQSCRAGDSSELSIIEQAVKDALAESTEDIDAALCLGVNPSGHSYPGRHARHVAMLATSIGMTMGLDETTLQELGYGCLIHDIGMLGIDQRIVETRSLLDLGEFLEITKHTYKTFDILEANLAIVPLNARMVAYQIHERWNGAGYPRRREGLGIHPLARIAAVADTYTALVAPRPHRNGLLPYFAMERMIRDTARGLYDPQVTRALLKTIGMFPIGSLVELDDRYVGRVIRANGGSYMQPVVEVWQRGNLNAEPSIVDLSQDTTLKIAKALPALEA